MEMEGRKRKVEYRYILVALVFFGYVNAFTMQSNLGVALVAMVKTQFSQDDENDDDFGCPYESYLENITVCHVYGEFEWDQYSQGIILSAFFYGYFVANIVGGRVTEVIGVKWSLGGGIFFSSLLTIVTPFAARWHSTALVVLRVIQGISQGSISPGVNYLTGIWFHREERGFLYSIMKSGINVGTVGGSVVSGYIAASGFFGGWPLVFYIFGLMGLVWCVLWYFLMHETPRDHPHISKEEESYIMDGVEHEDIVPNKVSLPWKSILTSMPVWVCVFLFFSENWGFNLLMSSQPAYMKNILHYHIKQNGVFSAVPPVAQTIIAVLSGRITDLVMTRWNISDTVIRKILVFCGSIFPALCLCLIAVTDSGCNRTAVIVLLTLCLGLSGSLIPGVNVAIVNISPRFSGTITGLANGFGEISGFLAPYMVGVFTRKSQTTEQWNKVFYVTSAIYVFPCVLFLLFGTSQLQKWNVGEKIEVRNNEK